MNPRGTIVCDVTDPLEGRSAAELANALATRLGLRVVLAFVIDGVTAAARESMSGRQRQSGAERALAVIAREFGEEAETRVAHGSHAETLAWVAAEEGADLVIVGSRAIGLGGRNLRCALVRDLEAATPVPVLVAPPSTRKHSGQRLAVARHAGTR
jgi:nucleotide-binding universal stress UspA family protein